MELLTCRGWRDRLLFEKLLFAVDQRIDVIGGELKTVPVRNRIRRARFNAITAENAARIIDVVDAGVALARGDAVCVNVLRGFDINAIRRTGCRAEEATNALFEAAFIPVENMNSAVARLKMHGFVRVVLRHCFAKHIAKSDAEAFYQRSKRFAYFPYDRWHKQAV